ncbi:hypothetical protein [Brucella intermedia]|uniref:hypothetical protein n=1 Tax=Brucella intermedia TaxID=94625 RepID=UPI00165D2B67|nr:hypothetical protein [Brucella intermedia]QNQ39380.1 hypothetical protein IAR37_08305 [Brucella intermedia]
MANKNPEYLQVVTDAFQANNSTEELLFTLKGGGGSGTLDGMNITDINNRLHRIEGGWHIFQWASAIVAAAFGVGLGVIVSFQLGTQSDVKDVSQRVDALSTQIETLPSRISSNLMEINRTLSEAITASKNQAPQVILVPAPAVQQPPQTTPNQ